MADRTKPPTGRRLWLKSGAALGLVSASALSSRNAPAQTQAQTQAQSQSPDNWPTRPIRVISPGSAGGGSDIFVRLLEPKLREKLGQTLFIENKPGAGGMVGASAAASATPDGYTFFVSNLATNGIGVTLYRKPTFDPKRDLPAVARIATLSNAVAVRSDSGIKTVAELVALLRANSAKALYGSAGSGTSSHLGAVLFGQKINIALTHVPYKGTAANLTALLGGEITFSIDNKPVYTPHVKAGTLRLLAVTSASRVSGHPEVPTMQEAGIADFDITSWYGLSAGTGTPSAVVERMGREIVSALADPAIVAKIREIGAEPAPLGPADYANFIDAEVRKWAPIINSSGAKVD